MCPGGLSAGPAPSSELLESSEGPDPATSLSEHRDYLRRKADFVWGEICRECRGRGHVLSFNAQAGRWDDVDCPSCRAMREYKQRKAEERRAELERAKNRKTKIVELAGAVYAKGPPPSPSATNGRCSLCDEQICVCDTTPSYAYDLARLVLEEYGSR